MVFPTSGFVHPFAYLCQQKKQKSQMLYLTEPEIHCPTPMPREIPQDYVNRIMAESDLTHRAVALRAQALGHKISAGYVHNIASGQIDNPSVQLVQALAAGLGRPEEEVFLIFRGKPLTEDYKDSFFATIWNEYRTLPGADQRELRVVLQMLQREIQRRLLKA